jgi:hypothetical protein
VNLSYNKFYSNFNIWYCTYVCWLCSRFIENRSSWSWWWTPSRGGSVTRCWTSSPSTTCRVKEAAGPGTEGRRQWLQPTKVHDRDHGVEGRRHRLLQTKGGNEDLLFLRAGLLFTHDMEKAGTEKKGHEDLAPVGLIGLKPPIFSLSVYNWGGFGGT